MSLSLKSERNPPTAFGYLLWQAALYCSCRLPAAAAFSAALRVFYLRTCPCPSFFLECFFLYISYLFPQVLKGS